LQARDRWNTTEIKIQAIMNTTEIKIQAIMNTMDHDGSMTIGHDEFRELLHSDLLRFLNDGKPMEDDDVAFVLRVASLWGDGRRLSFASAHDALRAWHASKSLDEASLLLFAEFDLDHKEGVELDALRSLMSALNGGLPVPIEEAAWVAEQASALSSSGLIERRDLLRAICTWHIQVDRAVTSLPTIWREAALRTSRELDQTKACKEGMSALEDAGALWSGRGADYLQVDGQPGALSPRSAALPGSGASSRSDVPLQQPLHRGASRKPALIIARAAGKLCFVIGPFILGLLIAVTGWRLQENKCPRNLDGILVWFGLLWMLFCSLLSGPRAAWIVHARIASAVILALLSIVGFMWAFDGDVNQRREDCGQALVGWSRTLWTSVPLCLLAVMFCVCGGHVKRLRDIDRRLQRDILV